MRCKETTFSGSRDEAKKILQGDSVDSICETLIALALHEPDRVWVEERCLECTTHPQMAVRAIAATALGHLARLHKTLDLGRVLPRLQALTTQASTAEYARAAIDDIRTYVPEMRAARERELEDLLKRGLALLTNTLSTKSGNLDASDLARTVELLGRILDEARIAVSPGEVERYIRDQLEVAPETAQQIGFVDRVLALDRNDPAGPWWPDDIVEGLAAKPL
ncbi:hypothetical protein WMF37_45565 [Sorangium sp. So ce291]|uniref:hypothetical protein n=1 Tax=Sorangium sp. So ce291 TaxID=3133294 RepID=UPI003F6098EA